MLFCLNDFPLLSREQDGPLCAVGIAGAIVIAIGILAIPVDPLWNGAAAFVVLLAGAASLWLTRTPRDPLRPAMLALTVSAVFLGLLMLSLGFPPRAHILGSAALAYLGLPATLAARALLKRSSRAAPVLLSGLAMEGAYLGTLVIRRASWEVRIDPESPPGAASLIIMLLFSAFWIAPLLFIALEQRWKARDVNQASALEATRTVGD